MELCGPQASNCSGTCCAPRSATAAQLRPALLRLLYPITPCILKLPGVPTAKTQQYNLKNNTSRSSGLIPKYVACKPITSTY
jgi:hypothetical protein